MIVLGPCWQKPLEWLPLGKPNVTVLRGENREQVPAEYRLDEIESEAVIEAMSDLLRRFPPSNKAREDRARRLLSNVRA